MSQSLKLAKFSVKTEYGEATYIAFGKARKTNIPVFYMSEFGLVEVDQLYPRCLKSVRAVTHVRPFHVSRRAIIRDYGDTITGEQYNKRVKEKYGSVADKKGAS